MLGSTKSRKPCIPVIAGRDDVAASNMAEDVVQRRSRSDFRFQILGRSDFFQSTGMKDCNPVAEGVHLLHGVCGYQDCCIEKCRPEITHMIPHGHAGNRVKTLPLVHPMIRISGR